MSDNYVEETQPLFKLLRTEAFRFVIVRYNHYSFIRQLEEDLQQRFPERPIKKIDAKNIDYQQLITAYFALKKGFFFIENFDDILKEERDSLQKETPALAIENERRRHIAAGLNLRRDKLAKYPIALFVFLPASVDKLPAKTLMEKMPDLWSFRSWMLDLEKGELKGSIDKIIVDNLRKLAKNNLEIIKQTEKIKLNSLLLRLRSIPEEEVAYRLTLYPQIVDSATEIYDYQLALKSLNEWEVISNESDKGRIWLKKGDIFREKGELKTALSFFEKAKFHFEKNGDKANVGVCFSKLGDVQMDLGNLEIALNYFEKDLVSIKELYEAYPENVKFKGGLAISYFKLGDIEKALGNFNKALKFFEKGSVLSKELYKTYPENIRFKDSLAISYEKLGGMQKALGNLDKALQYFEDEMILFKELYATYPENVRFKEGLAVSYEKLGGMQKALGNLDAALNFFEERFVLAKELYVAYPENVSFKDNLAVSYLKLGDVHHDLGDLKTALQYFEDYSKLEKELYVAYPENVGYKNGLAISYCNLAQVYGALNKTQQAKSYFEQAAVLLAQLANDFPAYAEFQRNYKNVQQDLAKF